MVIEPNDVQSFPIEIGKPNKFYPNRAVEFVFTLKDGSTIKGIAPAGEDPNLPIMAISLI